MELMIKYQYTYFIYPYVIDSKKYNKYLLDLLKNKHIKLRIFEKEKDMHLYNYFLPNIRDYMFWSFNLDKRGIKNLEQLDTTLKANILANHDCNIFQYELSKDLQGKVGEKNGIFFEINEIKLVCYKTGICFLVLKTTLQDDYQFSDILNFNYKFREINSDTYNLKEYENIKLQSDLFKDVTEISKLVQELTGENAKAKKINLDNDKFITYSFACIDQHAWGDEGKNEALEKEFGKFREILPASKQIVDDYNRKVSEIYQNEYVRYGFSNMGTVLLTSDISTENYTVLAQKFESEYLYTYLLELYKRFLLKRLNEEFNEQTNFPSGEKEFLSFTKKLWIQEITCDEFGSVLRKNWDKVFEIEEIFDKLKGKYELMYRKYDTEKIRKKNKIILVIILCMLLLNIINILLLFLKGNGGL